VKRTSVRSFTFVSVTHVANLAGSCTASHELSPLRSRNCSVFPERHDILPLVGGGQVLNIHDGLDGVGSQMPVWGLEIAPHILC